MPGYFTLEWRDGRKVERAGHRGYYYVFPDGHLRSFLPEPAWCHDCHELALCEGDLSAESVREEIESADDPNSEIAKVLADSANPGFTSSWKRKKAAELQHAESRALPSSCIECGGRNVFHFPDQEWIPHPETGEEVRMICTGMCSTDFAMKFYDPDGNVLNPTETERAEFIALINAGKTD